MEAHERIIELLESVVANLIQIRELLRPLRVTADSPDGPDGEPPPLDMKRATELYQRCFIDRPPEPTVPLSRVQKYRRLLKALYEQSRWAERVGPQDSVRAAITMLDETFPELEGPCTKK